MEGLRQAICMIYVALAEAAGGDGTLMRANGIIRDGLDDGVIDDPIGVQILAGIVEGTESELLGVDHPSLAFLPIPVANEIATIDTLIAAQLLAENERENRAAVAMAAGRFLDAVVNENENQLFGVN